MAKKKKSSKTASTMKVDANLTKAQVEKLSKFASLLDEEKLETGISPSPIAIGDLKEIDYKKLSKDVIEHYLLMHPVIPRGIELKANRMIRRGYTVSGGSDKAREYCAKILEDSGGLTLIKNWIKDAFGFGGAYLVLTRNKAKDEVLYLSPTHPVYFGISKYPKDYKDASLVGKHKINQKTKKPSYYSQYYKKHGQWEQYGNPIPANRVAHLKFDTWGDEAEGISIVQYLYLTVKYLLNIEDSAAMNMYRHGQTQKKLTTNITSEKKLKEIAKNVANMNSKNTIILPEGTDVNNLLPGQTQFPEYHDKFLTLLAIRLGIPKPLLTMDGTSTNKATLDEQKKDVIADFFADELVVKQTIEDSIFKSACKLKYGDDFTDIPNFNFNEIPEDKDKKTERLLKISMFVTNIVNSISGLNKEGMTQSAQKLEKFLVDNVDYTSESNKEEKIFIIKKE